MSQQRASTVGFLNGPTCFPKQLVVFATGVLLCMQISLGLAASGQVVAWGNNNSGQTDVPAGLTNVVAICAGSGNQSYALEEDGTLVGWGFPATPVLTNITALAAGDDHGLALQSNGTVVAWGTYFVNGGGSMPAFVPEDLSNVTAIAANASHDIALKADGTVAVWGSTFVTPPPADLSNVVAIAASASQYLALLSNGMVTVWGGPPGFPAPENLTDVVAIAASYYNFAAVKRDRSIVIWGDDSRDQLAPPVALSSNITAILPGYHSYLAIQDDGTLISWGANYYGQTNVPALSDPAIAISSGGGHSLALTRPAAPVIIEQPADQTVYSGRDVQFRVRVYGSSLIYQWKSAGTDIPNATNPSLQFNETQFPYPGPFRVAITNSLGTALSREATLTVTNSPPLLVQLDGDKAVALGQSAHFAVTVDGSGPFQYQWQFKGADIAVATNQTLQLSNVTLTAAGPYTVRVTNPIGTIESPAVNLSVVNVLAWGCNESGQTDVSPAATNVIAVAGGQHHSLALRADRTVISWGSQTNVPPEATNVIAISANGSNNLALRAGGTVVAWGDNAYGENQIPSNAKDVIKIAAGGTHDLVLLKDRSLLAWGNNDYGQITIPPDATNIVDITAGFAHSVARRNDGMVFAWGNKSLDQTNVPADLTNVTAIVAGPAHTLAIKSDGTVVGWGYNTFGQCDTPTNLSDVVACAAQQNISFALRKDGTITNWPAGSSCGTDNAPVGYSNIVGIAAGNFHTLAVIPWPAILYFDVANCGFAADKSGFRLRILGTSGFWPVVISGSTNLMDWTPIYTNPPIKFPLDYLDRSATNAPMRFYRAVEQ